MVPLKEPSNEPLNGKLDPAIQEILHANVKRRQSFQEQRLGTRLANT